MRNEFPTRAVVRGVDAGGRPFEVEGDVRNVSAVGLYVRLGLEVETGAALPADIARRPGPGRLARAGSVEPLIAGRSGMAVEFDSHQFVSR